MNLVFEANAIVAIASRDFLKFLRDPGRIAGTLIFPVIFIVAFGGSLQANLGSAAGYDFVGFTFTGVFAQTLFQTSAFGLISLIEDRETDFAQEMFVSPISRYSIILGKLLGETFVALPQGVFVAVFGLMNGIQITPERGVGLLLVGLIISFLGGGFGLVALSFLGTQRAANQVFGFIIFPQYFLGGMMTPIQILPFYLEILSRISPLRYAIDLTRGIFYLGTPEYDRIVLADPIFNASMSIGMTVVFILVGTALFVRQESNR